MGRFTKIPATPSVPLSPEPQHDSPVAAGSDQPRLSRLTVPDHQRWRSLESSLTIKKPAGQLRDEVIKAAALVWAHTPPRDPHNDRKAAAAVARYLFDEGVLHEQVSLERALTRAAVDRYLRDDLTHSQRSLKTLRTTLYCAGRVLYPREYPLPTTVPTRRAQATPPARSEDIAELYANLVYLRGQ